MKLKELKNTDTIKNVFDEYVVWVECPKCEREQWMTLTELNLEREHLCQCPFHDKELFTVKQGDTTVYPKEGP